MRELFLTVALIIASSNAQAAFTCEKIKDKATRASCIEDRAEKEKAAIAENKKTLKQENTTPVQKTPIPPSILGFNIGEKFSFQQCPTAKKSSIYAPEPSTYDYNIDNITASCWGKPGEYLDRPDRIENNGLINIFIPIRDLPGYIIPSSLMVFILNHNVEGVTFDFRTSEFDEVLKALIAKYGKPTTTSTRTASNAFGAQFESTATLWEFSDGYVYLTTNSIEFNKGNVDISTNKRTAFYKEKQQADKKPL